MRLTIRYPIHFTAEPPTTDRVKDVLCSFAHVADVPEVAASETALLVDVGCDDAQGNPAQTVLRSHEGSIYLRLCDVGQVHEAPVFQQPFEPKLDRNAPTAPFHAAGQPVRSLGLPMTNRIAHRLYASGGRTKEEYAWPPAPYQNTPSHRWTRNAFRFEELYARTGPIDEAMFDTCRAEHALEAEKLLVIDGAVYVRTPPLAWTVASKASNPWTVGVEVGVAFLPEWLDADLDRQYFPLSMREEADAYADTLLRVLKAQEKSGIRNAHIDRGLADRLPDMAAFDFDQAHYAVNRHVMLMASDIAMAIDGEANDGPRTDAGLAARMGHETVERVICSARAAIAIGPEIDRWADVTDNVEAVIAAWRVSGRKAAWANIPSQRSKVGEMLCERISAAAAEMPISLPIELGARYDP